MRRQLLIVTLAVLALRLPFLNQAIQGDDVYYLYGAEHAQIEPLHPTHVRYAFLGQLVDMRGHPHPPLDAWYLGAMLALVRDVREVPFHAAFIPFSLLAGYSALALARRFGKRPLAAVLLFVVTPAFVVNGTSLESDLPFVAFWLASLALFVYAVDRRSVALLAGSAFALALASMTAYQAVILTPLLLLYGRRWKLSWAVALTAPAVICIWQLWERASSGALPAAVLTGYMQTYGLQAFTQKIKNAVALTGHSAWLVFPALPVLAFARLDRWVLLPVAAMMGAAFYDPHPLFWGSICVGVLLLQWCGRHAQEFLAAWILVFFAAALVIFFAGSARYLLPIGLPVAILVSDRLPTRWLLAGGVAGAMLSLGLATVNYQHWDGYRQFARPQPGRVWINGEWGLRFYLEAQGGLPLMQAQAVHPGETVVSSSLAYPLKVTGALVQTAAREITSPIPLRLVALNGKSAYSTTLFGLRPFDISTGPIDRVRAETVLERAPVLGRLPMNAPESEPQIVSGIYGIENGQWRWMAQTGVLLLKTPDRPTRIEVRFYLPPQAPGRKVTLSAGGRAIADQTYPGPGSYTLSSGPVKLDPGTPIEISVDRTFSVQGDHRKLGLILIEAAALE